MKKKKSESEASRKVREVIRSKMAILMNKDDTGVQWQKFSSFMSVTI